MSLALERQEEGDIDRIVRTCCCAAVQCGHDIGEQLELSYCSFLMGHTQNERHFTLPGDGITVGIWLFGPMYFHIQN